MALRVWLPLNGNIENKGLSTLTSSGSPTFLDNGKMGKCISLTPRVSFTGLPKMDKFTILFWLRVDSCSVDWADSLSFTSKQKDGSSAAPFRFEATTESRACSYHNNSPHSITQTSRILIASKGEWHHCGFAYDGQNCYTYVDGIRKYTDAGLGGYIIDYFHIGETNNITGGMNDLRIYDECLSAKQIKEISKGLVLHYTFSGVGGENLEPGTNSGTKGWSYNVGDRWKMSITNDEWLGTDAVKVGITDGDTSSTNNWRVMQHRVNQISTILKPATTYTISFDTDLESKDWTLTTPASYQKIRIARGNSLNNLINTDTYKIKKVGVKVIVTFTTVAASSSYWDTIDQYIYIQFPVAAGSFAHIANLKMEEGDIATPWCPNRNDSSYIKYNYNRLGIIDTSGYENNGELNGTIVYKSDTPRYTSSSYFDDTVLQNIPTPFNKAATGITISLWFKPTGNNTMALYNCRTAVGEGVSIFYVGNKIRFDTSGSSQLVTDATYSINNWYHIVCTYKVGDKKKIYINGALAKESTTLGNLNTIYSIGSIGKSSVNGAASASNIVYGNLSDFRIYNTALSDDDVLELYRTSATIDNEGNLQCYELIEENQENLGYCNYGISSHWNHNGEYTRTVVDDNDAPSRKATKMECTTAGSGWYVDNRDITWEGAKDKMVHGQKYALIYYAKANKNKRILFSIECSSSQTKNRVDLTTEYQKVVNIFTYDANATYTAIISYDGYEVGDIVYISGLSIEKYNPKMNINKQGILNQTSLCESNSKKVKIYKQGIDVNELWEC